VPGCRRTPEEEQKEMRNRGSEEIDLPRYKYDGNVGRNHEQFYGKGHPPPGCGTPERQTDRRRGLGWFRPHHPESICCATGWKARAMPPVGVGHQALQLVATELDIAGKALRSRHDDDAVLLIFRYPFYILEWLRRVSGWIPIRRGDERECQRRHRKLNIGRLPIGAGIAGQGHFGSVGRSCSD